MNETQELLVEHAQADLIADRAVRKVFAILGVDIDKPADVADFQADLRFGKSMRRATDRGGIAVFVVICVATAGATWVGIVTQLTGHGK